MVLNSQDKMRTTRTLPLSEIERRPEEAVEEKSLSPGDLAKRVEEQERELKRIFELDKKFIATGDMEYLREFMSPPREARRAVTLRESLPSVPIVLMDWESVLATGKSFNFDAEKMMREDKALVKELYPNAQIREVTATDGKKLTAYIGVSREVLDAAQEMRVGEKVLEKQIREGKAKLQAAQAVSGDRATPISAEPALPLPKPRGQAR